MAPAPSRRAAAAVNRMPPSTVRLLVLIGVCLLLIAELFSARSCLDIHVSRGFSVVDSVSVASTFQLANQESLGFFTDVTLQDWLLMKQRVNETQPNYCPYCRGNTYTPAWFQNHYEPDFTCRHERRVGRLGDGGKWVCDPHLVGKDCLVYSVGSNGEFSFERAVKETLGNHFEIHTFDMANYSTGALQVNSTFHQWGIDGASHSDKRGRIYKTLQQTITELGHGGRTIDIFKIDCEGCEWSSQPSWWEANVTLRQVLVELHGGKDNQIIPTTRAFFEEMYRHHYVIFHKEPNIHYSRYGWAIEYSFLKLNQTFFKDMDLA